MNVKTLKDLLEVIDARIKLMLLFYPIIIMIFISDLLHLPQLKKVEALLPQPQWLKDTVEILINLMKLWNMLGYAFFFITLSWWGLRFYLAKLVFKSHLRNDWINSTIKSLLFILESSIWWYYLFALKIIFDKQSINLIIDNDYPYLTLPIALPAALLAFGYICEWLRMDTVGRSVRETARQFGLKDSEY